VKFKVGRLMRESLEDPATRGKPAVVVPAKARVAAKVEA
jgi:hypothetical protein